jgi:PAS domain S-box-containing protein
VTGGDLHIPGLPERGTFAAALIDTVDALVMVLDLRGRIMLFNRACERVSGWKSAEVLGLTTFDLLAEEARERGRIAFAKLVANPQEGPQYTAEAWPWRIRDGSDRYVLWTSSRMRGDDGTEYFIITGRDVTESRAIAAALRASEDRLRAAVGGSSDGLFDLDLVAGTAYHSPRFRALVGADGPPGERPSGASGTIRIISGGPAVGIFADLGHRMHPDDYDAANTAMARAMQGVMVLNQEFRLHVDGEFRWLLARGAAQRDADGKIRRFAGFLSDVTARKVAEQAVRDQEELLRMALAAARMGTWIWEPDGDRVRWSDSVVDIFGVAAAPRTMAEYLALIHPDDIALLQAKVTAAIDGPVPDYEVVHRVRRPEGAPERWLQCSGRVHYNADGGPERIAGTVVDITHQRQLAERLSQAQRMESVGRLAGGIAHDFNNLLTGIIGYGDLLRRRLSTADPLNVYVEGVVSAAERAAKLTAQLLAFSRKQMLQPKVLSPNSAVRGIEALLRRLVGDRVDMVTRLSPGIGRIRADLQQLEQALMNLAANARDAMPEGGRLTIATAAVQLGSDAAESMGLLPGPYVKLSVSDTGHGMEPGVRARIFEPFFTTKGPGKGTGLGLSMVYGIVLQSGGAIQCDSTPGVGTTFHLHLPQVDDGAEDPTPRPQRALVERSPGGSETVLVVEDEEQVRAVACEVLHHAGYLVLQERNGTGALGRAAGHPGTIHLLFTDLVMPGMGGRELARHLTAERPQIAVLFTSGHTDEAMPADQHFLPKPYGSRELALAVREAIDAANARTPKDG